MDVGNTELHKIQSLTSEYLWGKKGYEQVIPTEHGPGMGAGRLALSSN